MKKLSLGIVTDEISLDVREAVTHGLAMGISLYEIRSVLSGRIPLIDEQEWKDILSLKKEKQIQVSALSPGIFKHPLSKEREFDHELTTLLPRLLAMATEIGATLIIVFGFQREAGEPSTNEQKAIQWMSRAAALAAEASMTLVIENEPGFWCDTGANTASIIRAVNSPALRANWDPCNAYGTKELPFPDGYNAIKPYIANVHVKDTKKGSLIECVPVGEGTIDWQGQIRALMNDKPVEHISIETHCLPLLENSQKNVETVRRMMEEILATDTELP